MTIKLDPDVLEIPKAELHAHIEGTITPDECRRLAKKNGIAVSPDIFTTDGTAYKYNGFFDLVTRVYQEMARCVKTKDDYAEITYDYLRRCAAENTIYSELIACAGQCGLSGISYKDMIDGMAEGIDRAQRDFSIEARINLVFERHRSVDEAHKDADLFLSYPHPYVVGLGIAGGEQADDIPKFVPAFDHVIDNFPRMLGINPHSGEFQGPESVWDSLNFLHPARLGHGVRSIDDPDLITELVRRHTVLEVAPTSNILAEIYPSYAAHPLRKLKDAGVLVCLNSDDPGLFGNSIGMEYQIAKDNFSFTPQDLLQATKVAVVNAFADPATKQRMLRKVQDFETRFFNQPRRNPGLTGLQP